MLEIFLGYDNVFQGGLDFELRSQKGQRSNRCIFVLDFIKKMTGCLRLRLDT